MNDAIFISVPDSFETDSWHLKKDRNISHPWVKKKLSQLAKLRFPLHFSMSAFISFYVNPPPLTVGRIASPASSLSSLPENNPCCSLLVPLPTTLRFNSLTILLSIQLHFGNHLLTIFFTVALHHLWRHQDTFTSFRLSPNKPPPPSFFFILLTILLSVQLHFRDDFLALVRHHVDARHAFVNHVLATDLAKGAL